MTLNLEQYFSQHDTPAPPVCWTDKEESAFARIMAASGLARIQAIQLFKRVGRDMDKALNVAATYQTKAARAEKVRETKVSRQLAIFPEAA